MENTATFTQKSAQHVIPNPNGEWVVKKNGSLRATKRFHSKEEAIRYARKLGRASKTIVFIHGLDGRVIKTEEY